MIDPTSLPYAGWLEESLQNLIATSVMSICIISKSTDGEVLTGYYDCSVSDKLLFAGYLNQDAMIETLQVNGYISDDDEDKDEEYEGDIYDE